MTDQEDDYNYAVRWLEIAERIRGFFPDATDEEIDEKVERYLSENS